MFYFIILFITLLLYSIIACQFLFYGLALSEAQKSLGVAAYIELRKRIDSLLKVRLRIVYYCTLAACLIWLLLNLANPVSLLFITSVIALLALITDIILALKGNIPVNELIKVWSPDSYPDDWKDWRVRWFWYFHRRQVAGIAGFVSLLAGIAFGS